MPANEMNVVPNLAPPPETRKLDVFIGKWHAEGDAYGEGQSSEDPYASAVKWVSDETYEWLPGGFFLVHHWHATVGDNKFIGIEMLGYNTASGEYFSRMYDNNGNSPEYTATVEDDTWTFHGASTRAKVAVNEEEGTLSFNWEWKNEGENWLPLCNRKAVKIRQ